MVLHELPMQPAFRSKGLTHPIQAVDYAIVRITPGDLEVLVLTLCLSDISIGDFGERTLAALPGRNAPGLSSSAAAR